MEPGRPPFWIAERRIDEGLLDFADVDAERTKLDRAQRSGFRSSGRLKQGLEAPAGPGY